MKNARLFLIIQSILYILLAGLLIAAVIGIYKDGAALRAWKSAHVIEPSRSATHSALLALDNASPEPIPRSRMSFLSSLVPSFSYSFMFISSLDLLLIFKPFLGLRGYGTIVALVKARTFFNYFSTAHFERKTLANIGRNAFHSTFIIYLSLFFEV